MPSRHVQQQSDSDVYATVDRTYDCVVCVCVRLLVFVLDGTALGSLSIPLVKVILVVFYPIAKPVSMVLDYFLGKEVATYYSKEEVRVSCERRGGECPSFPALLSQTLACVSRFPWL